MMVKGSKEIEFEQSSLIAGFRIYTKPQKSFGRDVFYRKPSFEHEDAFYWEEMFQIGFG